MNIKLTITAAMILSLVTVVSGPAFGGEPDADPFVLNVTKVVDGGGAVGGWIGPYDVNVTCGSKDIDIEVSEGETVSIGDPIAFNDECIVTEIDPFFSHDRTATYACEATIDTTCVDNRTVAFDVSDAGGVGSITITNTWADPEAGQPPPDVESDAAALPPGVVAAQPAFTG